MDLENNREIVMTMGEYGYPIMTITSILKKHSITFEIDAPRQQALINDLNIQYSAPVDLTTMLKKCEFELSKIGIKMIVQQVNIDDWNNYLKDGGVFNLIHITDNGGIKFAVVSCDISMLSIGIMKGLGFDDHENNG